MGSTTKLKVQSCPKYLELEETLRATIQNQGFEQYDKHLERTVKTLPGHFIVIKDPSIMRFLKERKPLKKYDEDWERMSFSFEESVGDAIDDPTSRQLMVFNDENYEDVKQCFTHMQFIMTHRGNYDLYVYQRSADMSKLLDDLTFFAWVASKFMVGVDVSVPKIAVVYGSVHYEIKK